MHEVAGWNQLLLLLLLLKSATCCCVHRPLVLAVVEGRMLLLLLWVRTSDRRRRKLVMYCCGGQGLFDAALRQWWCSVNGGPVQVDWRICGGGRRRVGVGCLRWLLSMKSWAGVVGIMRCLWHVVGLML